MKCFVVSLLLLVVIAELVSARYGGYDRGISSSQDTDNNRDPHGGGYLSIEDTEKRDSQGFGNPGWVVVEDICQRSVILNEGNLDTWIIEDGRRNRSTQILC